MNPDDRWDDLVRDAYRRPIAGEEQARQRAIARLRREPPPTRSPWTLAWWVDAGTLRVRPWVAAASVVAVLALGAWGGAWWAGKRVATRETPVAVGIAGAPTSVTFVFRAPGASRVALVGDFNGWDPEATPLKRATLGDTWTAQVPLPRGLHAYAFVVDGRDWAPDPSAPLAAEATFGRRNSVLVVGEGGAL
jgi:hypothetical protein